MGPLSGKASFFVWVACVSPTIWKGKSLLFSFTRLHSQNVSCPLASSPLYFQTDLLKLLSILLFVINILVFIYFCLIEEFIKVHM